MQLLGVPRHQLIGPLQVRGRSPPRPGLERRRGVVEVEPPLFPAGGVVGECEVDVLRLHVSPQHEANTPDDPGLACLL
jgi:hypothetical protein